MGRGEDTGIPFRKRLQLFKLGRSSRARGRDRPPFHFDVIDTFKRLDQLDGELRVRVFGLVEVVDDSAPATDASGQGVQRAPDLAKSGARDEACDGAADGGAQGSVSR
jgi:hypothetical protein